jgi:hypothetical protein
MKNYFILITLFLVSFSGMAQDVIFLKKNKEEIISKVYEINETSIKYKKWNNLDGPIYNINISSVLMIKYSNGKKEIFNDNTMMDIKNEKPTGEKNIENQSEISKYPKLPRKDVPYYYDSNSNKIQDLESAISTSKRLHAGAWGHVTMKSIQGVTSNVKLSKQNKFQFIIQLSDEKANPNVVCELNLCEVKGQRQFAYSKEGAHGLTKLNSLLIEYIKLNDSGLYLIESSKNLSKGEYFFSIFDQEEVFAFSIDK